MLDLRILNRRKKKSPLWIEIQRNKGFVPFSSIEYLTIKKMKGGYGK